MKLTKLERSDDIKKNDLLVNWALTTKCNYRCYYCPPELNAGKHTEYTLEQILNFFKTIKQNQRYNLSRIFADFSGGEVSYIPWFGELLTGLHELDINSLFITNLSRSADFWESHVSKIRRVVVSYHHSSVGATGRDSFFNKLKILSSAPNIDLFINVMMDPKSFKEIYEFALKIEREIPSSGIFLCELLDNLTNPSPEKFPYTQDDRTKMELFKHKNRKPLVNDANLGLIGTNDLGERNSYDPDQLIKNRLNSFKGIKCYAGLDTLAINHLGEIFRGWCLVGGKIGNIADLSFLNNIRPITCSKEWCSCGFDLFARKG